jgi:hypothetical protein
MNPSSAVWSLQTKLEPWGMNNATSYLIALLVSATALYLRYLLLPFLGDERQRHCQSNVLKLHAHDGTS